MCWILTAAAIASFLTFHGRRRQSTQSFPFLSLLMSQSTSLKAPPRPPPYPGRGGGPGSGAKGTREARERFKSGSPSRSSLPISRGGSTRPPRGRSISVTVCQYAAPQDKKTETLKVKQRPLSLPDSSILYRFSGRKLSGHRDVLGSVPTWSCSYVNYAANQTCCWPGAETSW